MSVPRHTRPIPAEDARATYHHGSLRAELMSACVALIEAEGIAAVSLRRVAREAGVSPGAPYHHFADRGALLAAIAVDGSRQLEERLRRARAEAPTALRALGALIEAYVAFAAEKPAHVRLLLRPELSEPEGHPEVQEAGAGAVRLLAEVVEACQREHAAPPGDPSVLVNMVWALAIGIVTLWLDGPLESRCVALETTPQQLSEQIAALLQGLLAGAAG
jgi:AcrR family transcriptional regulator